MFSSKFKKFISQFIGKILFMAFSLFLMGVGCYNLSRLLNGLTYTISPYIAILFITPGSGWFSTMWCGLVDAWRNCKEEEIN